MIDLLHLLNFRCNSQEDVVIDIIQWRSSVSLHWDGEYLLLFPHAILDYMPLVRRPASPKAH
jgi:hypothetical protein